MTLSSPGQQRREISWPRRGWGGDRRQFAELTRAGLWSQVGWCSATPRIRQGEPERRRLIQLRLLGDTVQLDLRFYMIRERPQDDLFARGHPGDEVVVGGAATLLDEQPFCLIKVHERPVRCLDHLATPIRVPRSYGRAVRDLARLDTIELVGTLNMARY